MNVTHPHDNQQTQNSTALRELQAIRQELTALRHLLDHFAATFLNARFPYGKPLDKWRSR